MNDTTAPARPDAHSLDRPDDLDPRAAFARACALASEAIAALRPDQFGRPTPCDAMVVRDLLAHMVMAVQRATAAGRGAELHTWPVEPTGIADDAWPAVWAAAVREAATEWRDDTRLDRPTVLPWGMSVGRRVLAIYTNEVIVHTWDLARATDQSVEWDDDVLAVAFDVMRTEMPAAGRQELYDELFGSLPPDVPREVPFELAVEIPDGAPVIDQLVAWNGRNP